MMRFVPQHILRKIEQSLTLAVTRLKVFPPLFQVSHGLSSTGLNGKPVRHLDDNPGAAPATVSESKVNQHATAYNAREGDSPG